jgi:ribonuclease H / adenosylcobalamin/alpha-ribazole phosphatase
VEIFLDSNLVVEQIKGKYRVKKAELQPLHKQAMELLADLGDANISHVEREKNRGADALANMALDAQVKKPRTPG